MLKRLRERTGSEKGFTLIELLVVMLILGILAAIAIPAFLNQKNKANDAQSKVVARTLQTAMETCSTDNNGSYNPPGAVICDLPTLTAIEATLPGAANAAAVPNAAGTAYTVTGTNTTTGNSFTIARSAAGVITHTCLAPGADRGGCPPSGNW